MGCETQKRVHSESREQETGSRTTHLYTHHELALCIAIDHLRPPFLVTGVGL